jgi:hypothetical protein
MVFFNEYFLLSYGVFYSMCLTKPPRRSWEPLVEYVWWIDSPNYLPGSVIPDPLCFQTVV